MSIDDAMVVVLTALTFVLGGIIGACSKHAGCDLRDPLPVEVPAGLAMRAADWEFSPTGGYIHIDYKPKDYKPKEENR